MRRLSVDDVSVGQRVLYSGPASSGDVLNPDRRRLGHILMPHHPGLIREAESEHHVVVAFRGLEDEPISWGIGFGCHEQTGVYPALLLPDADEWELAVAEGWWTGCA